jgi:hypothetical protein
LFGVNPDGTLAVCALAFGVTIPGADDAPPLPGMATAATEQFLAHGLPAVAAGGTQDMVAEFSPADLVDLATRLADTLSRRFGDRQAGAAPSTRQECGRHVQVCE